MTEPYPPQILRGDPEALYGKPNAPGNGPLVLNQNSSPNAGDSVLRNAAGYWENGPVSIDNLATILGNLRQLGNEARPARSNVSSMSTFADGALAATGVGCFVPVEAAPGDVFTRVNVPIGATAGGTMTHQFAALYAGTGAEPVLIGQSTDTTSAAIAEKKLAGWNLTTPVTVTEAMAPHGFVYAEIAITATTIPSAATYGTPAGTNYQWGTNAPLFFSFTAGTALAGTAAAKIESAAAKVVAPVVILT
jgi:hypothetical protein